VYALGASIRSQATGLLGLSQSISQKLKGH
jgi:hypothetical protein